MIPLLLACVALFTQTAGGAITGTVTDSESHAPVVDARVVVVNLDARLSGARVIVADDRGRWTTGNVTPGRYRMFAERDGYLRGEAAAAVTVAAGQAAEGVSIALVPTGAISGRVTTEDGDPAPRILVRALTPAGMAAEARTDDRGDYRLFGLPAGRYVVSAERYLPPRIENGRYLVPTPPCPDCMGEGQSMLSLQNVLNTGGFIDPRALGAESYPTVYFPDTIDRAAAQPVDLRPGAEVSAIDVRLIVQRGR